MALAGLAVLTPPAALAVQVEYADFHRTFILPASGALKSSAAVELNGDHLRDAAQVSGDDLKLFFNPGLMQAIYTLSGNDPRVRALPGGNPLDSERGAFVLTSSVGLPELIWIHPTAGELRRTSFADSSWINPRQLRVDASGTVWALSADGMTVHSIEGGPTEPTGMASVSLDEAATDFVPLHWDGLEGRELIVANASSTTLLSSDGALMQSFSDTVALCMTTVPSHQPQRERLAAAVLYQGIERLLSWDSASMDPVDVLGMQSIAVTGGDRDADGRIDIVFGHKTNSIAPVMFNQGGTAGVVFSWDSSTTVDPTGPLTDGWAGDAWDQAEPTLADLDLDEDADLFTGVAKDGTVTFTPSESVEHIKLAPTLSGGEYWFLSDGSESLKLNIERPEIYPAGELAAVAVAWVQDAVGTPVDPNSIDKQVLPVGEWPVTLELAIPADRPANALYHVVLQVAQYDASTASAGKPGPPAVWCYSIDPAVIAAIVEDHGTIGEPVPIYVYSEEDEIFSGTSSSVPLPCMPPLPDDSVPN